MRHYLNLLILHSVWTEYDLIPSIWRSYNSESRGWWLVGGLAKGTGEIPPWMKSVFPLLSLSLFLSRFVFPASAKGSSKKRGDTHDRIDKNRYQIFAPILALQLVNSFWSYLIWRCVSESRSTLRHVRQHHCQERTLIKKKIDRCTGSCSGC